MSGIVEQVTGLALAALTALGLIAPEANGWNGYLEADYLYLAPVSSGRITEIGAEEGAMVVAGAPLVRLETGAQVAALAGAKAAVAQAEANLDNLQTGSRAAEIAVIEASLRRAQSDRDLAEANFARTTALALKGEATEARRRADQGALQSATAQVEQLQAQLDVARLPARAAQRLAAEAVLAGAQAAASQAQIALDDRQLAAPIAGRIDHRFYDPGEVAAAGAPILSIYDPARLKVIFFIPEAARASLTPGARLSVTCDGCPDTLTATLTRIGAEPQFTPPILYSREQRDRLVFRAEALLQADTSLTPGQPVTLAPAP